MSELALDIPVGDDENAAVFYLRRSKADLERSLKAAETDLVDIDARRADTVEAITRRRKRIAEIDAALDHLARPA